MRRSRGFDYTLQRVFPRMRACPLAAADFTGSVASERRRYADETSTAITA